jgi:hypothetical protein
MSLRHEIRRLAFLRYLVGGAGMTLEQATREAGRELALKRNAAKAAGSLRTQGESGRAGGMRQQLIAKLFDGHGRGREPPPPPPHIEDPLVEPTQPVVAPPVTVRRVELERASSIIGVYLGGTTGAMRIDDEFPPDLVTANWRGSIEANWKRLGGRYR